MIVAFFAADHEGGSVSHWLQIIEGERSELNNSAAAKVVYMAKEHIESLFPKIEEEEPSEEAEEVMVSAEGEVGGTPEEPRPKLVLVE